MREQGGKLAPLPRAGREQFLALVQERVDNLEADGLIPPGWFERIQRLRGLD